MEGSEKDLFPLLITQAGNCLTFQFFAGNLTKVGDEACSMDMLRQAR